MFQPASLKGDSPTPVDERLRFRFLPIYFLIISLSFIPLVLIEYTYIFILWRENLYLIFWLLIPLNLIISFYTLQLAAILISFLILNICKLVYLPKEGIFKRNINDRAYYFWNFRNMIKKWPLYLTATNPFPWLKNRFTLRFFGVKIGKNAICDNAWISSEFIKIGKNIIIGMGSTILSFGIEQDKFIIKNILIKDNVIIGAKCVLLPGTRIEENVMLNALSYTNYEEYLVKNKKYKGRPAKIKEE